jgi:hypothetical protein
MSDAHALALPDAQRRDRFKRPHWPGRDFWWLWLAGAVTHISNAVLELLAGATLNAAKDTVAAVFWWLGLHAWRAGDHHRARLLAIMIVAFDLSQSLLS